MTQKIWQCIKTVVKVKKKSLNIDKYFLSNICVAYL